MISLNVIFSKPQMKACGTGGPTQSVARNVFSLCLTSPPVLAAGKPMHRHSTRGPRVSIYRNRTLGLCTLARQCLLIDGMLCLLRYRSM